MITTAAILICVTGLLAGVVVFIRRRDMAGWERLGAALVFPLLSLFIAHAVSQAMNAPFWAWNGARLAPTFALARGLPLYSGPDKGAVLNTIYGPVAAEAYYPVTFISQPDWAIAAAALLAFIWFFAPVVLCLWSAGRDSGANTGWRGLLFLTFCLLSALSPALSYSAFRVHADAPALGLAVMACWCIARVPGIPRWRDALPAAVFAVLAVWTKQTMAPVVVALVAYAFLAWGWPATVRLVMTLGVAGFGISAMFLRLFDKSDLVFNMFTIVSQHALEQNLRWYAVHYVKQLGWNSLVAWLVLLPAVLLFLKHWLGGKEHLRRLCAEQVWLLPLIVAVLLVPGSFYAFVKIGGDVNSLSPPAYFLLLSAVMFLVRPDFSSRLAAPGALPRLPVALTAATVVIAAGLLLTRLPDSLHRADSFSTNQSRQVFTYAREHPGQAYFPWNPLEPLMAEGRLYHFDYGLFDRDLAQLPLTQEHLRAYVPEKAEWMLFTPTATRTKTVTKYLPEFKPAEAPKEFSGWEAFQRTNPAR